MSGQAEERAAIVAALAAVPGLSPTPTPPDTLVPGAAWPVWDSTEPLNPCVYPRTWAVWVVLPAGSPASTVHVGDTTADDVADALWKVPAKVVRCEPDGWSVEPGGTRTPAIRFTLQT